jgi:hypothetical protein
VVELLIDPIIGLVKDGTISLWRKFKKPDPLELVTKRQRLKVEVESRLQWIDKSTRYGEVIIRDVRRVDEYPNVKEKSKGISSWFRVTLVGTYHRGIQVGLSFYSLKWCPKEESWHLTRDYKASEMNALLVGRIPYDRIVTIDWSGDEYYSEPHIYCLFTGWRPSPYEELVFCEEYMSDYPQPYSWYKELVGNEKVRKLTKKYEPSYFA